MKQSVIVAVGLLSIILFSCKEPELDIFEEADKLSLIHTEAIDKEILIGLCAAGGSVMERGNRPEQVHLFQQVLESYYLYEEAQSDLRSLSKGVSKDWLLETYAGIEFESPVDETLVKNNLVDITINELSVENASFLLADQYKLLLRTYLERLHSFGCWFPNFELVWAERDSLEFQFISGKRSDIIFEEVIINRSIVNEYDLAYTNPWTTIKISNVESPMVEITYLSEKGRQTEIIDHESSPFLRWKK